MIFAGIDIGSTTTETVFTDENGKLIAKAQVLSGFDMEAASEAALSECCKIAGVNREDIKYCIGTGYGRELIKGADEQYTEIACHARGAHYCFPEVRGVIDIGGQDSKAIAVTERGGILDFGMNDKCAAGTGRFLEVMAGIMGISVGEMGQLSLKAEKEVKVSSICTVFAESEVISLLSKKEVSPYDIMGGIHSSVVRRVNMLVQKARLQPPIAMTGGVAKNVGVVAAFEKLLNTKILIPEDPQCIGALGASIIACERYMKKAEKAKQ